MFCRCRLLAKNWCRIQTKGWTNWRSTFSQDPPSPVQTWEPWVCLMTELHIPFEQNHKHWLRNLSVWWYLRRCRSKFCAKGKDANFHRLFYSICLIFTLMQGQHMFNLKLLYYGMLHTIAIGSTSALLPYTIILFYTM